MRHRLETLIIDGEGLETAARSKRRAELYAGTGGSPRAFTEWELDTILSLDALIAALQEARERIPGELRESARIRVVEDPGEIVIVYARPPTAEEADFDRKGQLDKVIHLSSRRAG